MSRGMRMSQMGNWVEVAPSPYIRPRRHSSSPKLETIFEEGCYGIDDNSCCKTNNIMAMEVHAPKRIVYLLPVLISMATYYALFRNICA